MGKQIKNEKNNILFTSINSNIYNNLRIYTEIIIELLSDFT